MISELKKEDFHVLLQPAFNRLHPTNVSVFFVVCTIVTLLIGGLPLYFVKLTDLIKDDFLYMMGEIYFVLLLFQLFFTAIFLSDKIIVKFQKLQSILLILFGLKLATDPFLTFFLLCYDDGSPDFLVNLGKSIFFFGFIFLIYSVIRAVNRVKKGKFRRGGPGLLNVGDSLGYVSMPIIFGASIFGMNLPNILSNFTYGSTIGISTFLLVITVVYFCILLVLPEFILLAYCKYRFSTFNYIPEGKEQK